MIGLMQIMIYMFGHLPPSMNAERDCDLGPSVLVAVSLRENSDHGGV
jgi:hypothetical protein